MRTVEWADGKVRMIDQRLLPWEEDYPEYEEYEQVADAIRVMVVRGAPAIGASAAFGMVLAAMQSKAGDRLALIRDLEEAAEVLKAARPTAVNLAWAADIMLRVATDETLDTVDEVRDQMLARAQKLADDDIATNKRMAEYGASLVREGDTILHHCNTGALATVDWGTALGVIRTAHEQGKNIHVLLDETRPRLQGSRLSAWELDKAGIPFDIIADNAAGHFMQRGEVDIVFVGSDRTAANGDVANKIGTYQVAVVADANGVPFYPVVPTSTVDMSLGSGQEIPIEERSPDEVRAPYGLEIVPESFSARNPAFDVTPNRYVTGIVTERGIAYPPFDLSLAKLVQGDE